MSKFENISDKELVAAAQERSDRIVELTQKFQDMEKKVREIKENARLTYESCERIQKEYKQILSIAKKRGIKTT